MPEFGATKRVRCGGGRDGGQAGPDLQAGDEAGATRPRKGDLVPQPQRIDGRAKKYLES